MKRQVLERAQGTVRAFLKEHGVGLDVLSVRPEVDGDGDEFLWVDFGYDDGDNARGVPDASARLQLVDRLRAKLQGEDVEAFPVVSFIAKSEVESDASAS